MPEIGKGAGVTAGGDRTSDERAEAAGQICAAAMIWDAHAGLFPAPSVDMAALGPAAAAGVGFMSVNVGFDLFDGAHAMATAKAYAATIAARPDLFVAAGSVADVLAARESGRMAVAFDIEGANALDGRLDMVGRLHAAGVRQMLLAYNRNTLAAGGCHDADGGLTDFGRRVIAEMNRLGMIVDATHCGARSSLEMIDASETPVVFSHSNAAAVWPHGRNISDPQIRACAARGGLVGTNGISLFLGGTDRIAARMADHVCHVAELAGTDHVALGLDWVPPGGHAPDLGETVRARPEFWPPSEGYASAEITSAGPEVIAPLVAELLARGWSRAEVEGFLGGNMLRLARAVWGG